MSFSGRMEEAAVALSLCGHLVSSKTAPETMQRIFESHAVSMERFMEDPGGVVLNPQLVACVDGVYYTGAALVAMAVAQAAFKQPLPGFVLDPAALVQKLPSRKKGLWNWRLWPFSRQQPKQQTAAAPSSSLSSSAVSSSASATPAALHEQQQQQPQEQQATPATVGQGTQQPQRRRCIRPTQEQLEQMGAHKGQNKVTFTVDVGGGKSKSVACRLWLLDSDDKLVISDIDGTITKSDALGHIMNALGKDWSQSGVAELYTAIQANGYQLVYLTARAIGFAQTTRNFITSVSQKASSAPAQATAPATTAAAKHEGSPEVQAASPASTGSTEDKDKDKKGKEGEEFFTLPPGPVLMSPMRLLTAVDKELVQRCPQEFKIACLTDIFGLFPPGTKPFHAGFGNRSSVCPSQITPHITLHSHTIRTQHARCHFTGHGVLPLCGGGQRPHLCCEPAGRRDGRRRGGGRGRHVHLCHAARPRRHALPPAAPQGRPAVTTTTTRVHKQLNIRFLHGGCSARPVELCVGRRGVVCVCGDVAHADFDGTIRRPDMNGKALCVQKDDVLRNERLLAVRVCGVHQHPVVDHGVDAVVHDRVVHDRVAVAVCHQHRGPVPRAVCRRRVDGAVGQRCAF